MMSAWHITAKDLLLLSRDKRALVLLLILPLMFISIIGMSTGQLLTRDENSELFKIIIVDDNESDTSHNLIRELSQKPEILLLPAPSKTSAQQMLRSGDASMILEIGPQFENLVDEVRVSDIFNAKSGPVTTGLAAFDLHLETKSSAAGVGRLLEAVIRSQVIGFIAPIAAAKNPVTRAWVRSRESDLEDELAITLPAVSTAPEVHTAQSTRPKPNAVYLWVVPGFTVMFAFFVISIMARSFIIERDQGTLRRLMMAPIGSVSVLLGKTMPFYLTSVLQCSLLFLCGRLLFGMPWGSQPYYLIPVILCTSAAATSLGLLLSTLVQTDQQVSSYGTTLILMFSSISGCFFPREFFPKTMRTISLITPHAWSLKAFDAVLTQPHVELGLIASCCGMLLVFTTICFTTGWWRFRATAQI